MLEELFKHISEQWFLREPAFFALYCTLQLKSNEGMKCFFRSGEQRVEYNPVLLAGKTEQQVEALLKIELIRIFLKHPYQRQPDGVSHAALTLGSDCTIADGYQKREDDPVSLINQYLKGPADWNLPEGECFEWYTRRLDEMLEDQQDSSQSRLDSAPLPEQSVQSEQSAQSEHSAESEQSEQPAESEQAEQSEQTEQLESTEEKDSGKLGEQTELSEQSELWHEDSLASQEINDLIKTLNSWGSMPGDLVQQIIASSTSKIDYRLIMQGFRGQILSSKRRLTRMRPNRRTGFDQMGQQRKFDTRLLVAVDVSGSISDRTLCNFYGVVMRFFRYGIDQIDCVQFDAALGEVQPIRKARREIEICGRGGTSFQPIFDYLLTHNNYDGLVILTDGGAAHPHVDASIKAKVLWVCEDESSYNACHGWMQLFGRVCWMVV